MIPPSNSRPFGRVLTPLSEIDLARLIVRTGQLAAAAHHEQGWAAFAIGCDGRKRTTFFDGSTCQVEGDVCLAQRQDGISSCIDVPARGSGLTSQSIVFRVAACSPVTGWYLLDSAGYLYRIPADLVTAAPYWPIGPDTSGRRYDFVRSGTWAVLMCAAELDPPALHDDGGSTWALVPISSEESRWAQVYETAVGGCLTHLETVPSLTPSSGQVVASALSGRWTGLLLAKATTTTLTLNQNDANSAALASGEVYKVLIYAAASGTSSCVVVALKGVKGLAAAALAPDNPTPLTKIPLGIATVEYGGTVTVVSTGSTTPVNLDVPRALRPSVSGEEWSRKGLVLRDAEAPNAGMRSTVLTLPSAGTGLVTGEIRAAWGYPMAWEMLTESVDGGAPFASTALPTTRDPYDMAFVFGPPRVGVEYGPYHLNLSGGSIADPGDSTMLSAHPGDEDYAANVLALPNGELAVLQPYTDGGSPIVPPMFKRYRIRAAPSEPPTVALSQIALGTWPVDDNVWTDYRDYVVDAWLVGDTSFTLSAGSWTHGKPCQCVLWQANGSTIDHWTEDVDARAGTLDAYTGAVASVSFLSGGAPTPRPGETPMLTILGPALVAAWGYTYSYRDPVTSLEYETALSPLTEPVRIAPTTATYTITLDVPIGPSWTFRRNVYRFAYDQESGVVAGVHASPWDSRTSGIGSVYDRMCTLVGSIDDNVTTAWVDEGTTLSFAGTRPPSPVIEVGSGITFDAPGRPIALPPLNL